MKLLVDDVHDIESVDFIARNYLSGKLILEKMKNMLSHLYLDHDLGIVDSMDYEHTGYDLLKYELENNLIPNTVTLVTANPAGWNRMAGLLFDKGYTQQKGIFKK